MSFFGTFQNVEKTFNKKYLNGYHWIWLKQNNIVSNILGLASLGVFDIK